MDLKFKDSTLKKLKKYDNIRNLETIIYTKEGKPIDVLLSSDVIELRGNKYNLTTALDISKRKKAEQIQKILYNISNAVNSVKSLRELIALIKNELGTLIDTTNFYVALYDEQSDTFTLPFHQDKIDDRSYHENDQLHIPTKILSS